MLQRKVILTIATAAALLPFAARNAQAETFTVSANGDNSASSVNVVQNQNNNVQQTNDAEVTNNVVVDANTGDNSASRNTNGDSSINTGDVTVTTQVENSVNHSHVDSSNCCNSTSNQAAITNNGPDSTNTITYTSQNTNTVTVNQTANIRNTIYGNVNTGGNTADRNNGNVSITTGSISVKEAINNVANTSYAAVATGGNQGFSIKISGNGAGSTNTVTLNQDANTLITVNNAADIFNQSIWNLITGNNSADRNNGNVDIRTGDINLAINIKNDVNTSTVKVDCDCDKEEVPPPSPCEEEKCKPVSPPPPSQEKPSESYPAPTGGVSSPPSVLGVKAGEVLPITGTPWILLAIIGNLLMLLFGAVLRLRSGRSPGFAFAL